MNTSRDSRKRDRHQESHRNNDSRATGGTNRENESDRNDNINHSHENDDRDTHERERDSNHHHSNSNSQSYRRPHSHNNNAHAHAHSPPYVAPQQSPSQQDSFGAVQECIHETSGSGPQKSVEGWVVIVTGCHEEAQEEDISDAFAEYGQVKNININLDRRTGFCKGYALVEYKSKSEAQDSINALHGTALLGKTVHVDWAFVASAADGFKNQSRKKTKGR